MRDAATLGSRFAAVLKPRSQMLVPVLFASFIAVITLSPAHEAQAMEVRVSEAVDLDAPSAGPVLANAALDRNQRPEVQATKAMRDTDALQEARGVEFIQNARITEAAKAYLGENDLATATAVRFRCSARSQMRLSGRRQETLSAAPSNSIGKNMAGRAAFI